MPVAGLGGSAGTSGLALGWEWRPMVNATATPKLRPA